MPACAGLRGARAGESTHRLASGGSAWEFAYITHNALPSPVRLGGCVCRLVLLPRAPARHNRVVPVRASQWPLRHPQEVGKKHFFRRSKFGVRSRAGPAGRGHGACRGAACAMKLPLGETAAQRPVQRLTARSCRLFKDEKITETWLSGSFPTRACILQLLGGKTH